MNPKKPRPRRLWGYVYPEGNLGTELYLTREAAEAGMTWAWLRCHSGLDRNCVYGPTEDLNRAKAARYRAVRVRIEAVRA